MKTVDSETEEEISRSETIKGYEYSKGRYVTITDEDLDAVRVESSTMMAIEKFVDAASIDPIYYDASYYLAPDGKGAEDVYAVVREAIARTGRVALTRIVIAQRERTVAVRPIEGGLAAHTLNEQRDLNEAGTLFDTVRNIAIDPSMIDLAIQTRSIGRHRITIPPTSKTGTRLVSAKCWMPKSKARRSRRKLSTMRSKATWWTSWRRFDVV